MGETTQKSAQKVTAVLCPRNSERAPKKSRERVRVFCRDGDLCAQAPSLNYSPSPNERRISDRPDSNREPWRERDLNPRSQAYEAHGDNRTPLPRSHNRLTSVAT